MVAIAELNGLPPREFYKKVVDIISENGYLTGTSDEKTFWQTLRDLFGIKGSDEYLRTELLKRFEIRQWMIDAVKELKKHNICRAILSDQTNWLDELNAKHDFFRYFDRVFNSYHLGKGKQDPSIFDDLLAVMNTPAHRALFIDDNKGHIERAKQRGLNTIFFIDRKTFEQDFACFFPWLQHR